MLSAKEITEKNRQAYNQIAREFTASRKLLAWPEIDQFKAFCSAGQTLLDLGCGSGRLVNFFSDLNLNYYGLDLSEELIKQAQANFPELAPNFQVGEMTNLPWPDNYFDRVVCLASFHHLPDKKTRQQALAEIHRVLKKSGLLLMTNWYLYQTKLWQNFFTNFREKNNWRDFFIPWKTTAGPVYRYYHGFGKNELKNLFFPEIWQIIKHEVFARPAKQNWLTIVKKLK